MQSKYPYPFIECSRHPGQQRSYCVCNHVHEGSAPPLLTNLADDQDMGDLVCAECLGKRPVASMFKAVCEGCVVDHGWLIHL